MIINRIPRNATSEETFRECYFNYETITAGTWTDVNVNTLYGIPKKATLMCSIRVNGTGPCGLRQKGSIVERKQTTTSRLSFVNTNADGVIQVYGSTGVDIFILGYWNYYCFTETHDDISAYAAGSFTSRDIYTDFSIPKGRVCNLAFTSVEADISIGVRTEGSVLTRTIALDKFYRSFAFLVKSDASTGEVELKFGTPYDAYIEGYFDDTIDYEELDTTVVPSISNGWNEYDLSAELAAMTYDNNIIDIIFTSNDAAFVYIGSRKTTSSTERKLYIGNYAYSVNMLAPCLSDSSKVVDLYCEDSTDIASLKIFGYFK